MSATPAANPAAKLGKEWQVPNDADTFFKNGIDWDKWQAEAKPPPMYDPPQMAPGYMSILPWCNWWQQRSPLLRSPCCPCGLAPCWYKCCVRGVDYLPFAEPDEWMMKMLSTGTSPNCPDHVKGIWWMCDNIAAHEHLVTFHDAVWANDSLALKQLRHNWTRGPTAFGAALFWFVQMNGNHLRIEVSPNKKWLSIAGSSGNPTWIYVTGPEDKFELPGGGTLPLEPGEMQRVSFANNADPKAKVTYQYRVRRIAYLDEHGKLVKTKAYDDLKKVSSEPLPHQPCCCGYCWCLTKEQRAFKNFPQLPSHTVVKYAPVPAPVPQEMK